MERITTILYKTNTEPIYVLMVYAEENLIELIGYMPDPEKYYEWLETGDNHLKQD